MELDTVALVEQNVLGQIARLSAAKLRFHEFKDHGQLNQSPRDAAKGAVKFRDILSTDFLDTTALCMMYIHVFGTIMVQLADGMSP